MLCIDGARARQLVGRSVNHQKTITGIANPLIGASLMTISITARCSHCCCCYYYYYYDHDNGENGNGTAEEGTDMEKHRMFFSASHGSVRALGEHGESSLIPDLFSVSSDSETVGRYPRTVALNEDPCQMGLVSTEYLKPRFESTCTHWSGDTPLVVHANVG